MISPLFTTKALAVHDRYKKILKLLSEGNSAREISEQMNRNQRCVQSDIIVLRKKFCCKNTSQLLYKIAKENII